VAPGKVSPFGTPAAAPPANGKASAFGANAAAPTNGKASPFGTPAAASANGKASPFGTPAAPTAAGPGKPPGFAANTAVAPPAAPPAFSLAPGNTDARSKIQIKGLTGTLNKGDIHQTMEARQGDFDACIEASRRRLRWVSGSIRFAFKVDGEGRILDVHPTTSNIGHGDLEQCLSAAVATTQFPKPAGRANAEFAWGLSVEPATGKPVESASPKIMASLARKQAKEVFSTCEIRRRRARFKVTAYLAPTGRMLSVGAVALPAGAQDKVSCVLEELSKWHTPKVKRSSKVSFDLR
jgi:hypothetical protein